MRILIVDHYDSFTSILAQLVSQAAGSKPDILKSDKVTDMDLSGFSHIILSPGPGLPAEATGYFSVIDKYKALTPILGVCLGHQGIAEYFGSGLKNTQQPAHGFQSRIKILKNDAGLFRGLNSGFHIGRYHSWLVDPASIPEELKVTALDEECNIMAVQHKCLKIYGVQFHPESYMTEHGIDMIRNFLDL